ncbi:hypothetical protein [uncultured Legionella sp.]|uniref:hypothetical protein n=1 Tax=uncultured Legionella sp. TaxID=210934 RepID=UPI0026067124|nr:hypothetical protein [uncultured Legionella sp.]
MYQKNITILCSQIIVGLSLVLNTLMAQAGGPLWSFTPITQTDITIAGDSVAKVAYYVKNNSHKEKTLVMKHISGVQQMAPCRLAPSGQANDTCLLRLFIRANQLPSEGVKDGLAMCQANANGSPNPNQCYQPVDNNLNIRVSGIIIATPPGLTFPINNNGTITIHQAVTAQALHNIKAIIPAGSAINVTNNCPDILEPDTTCTMDFSSPVPEGPTAIAIKGINTNSLNINVTATSSTTASLNTLYRTYTLTAKDILTRERGVTENSCISHGSTWDSGNGLCESKSRVINITNFGSATAQNVTYSISPSLPSGTIVTPASCGDIAPNDTCSLTITPGSTPTSPPGTEPTPSTLTVTGDNVTSPLDISITVLTYGNIVQGGYLFDIEDVPGPAEIVGKVMTDSNAHGPMQWGPLIEVGGINENSHAGPNSCNGSSNGQCNTTRIMNANLNPPLAAAVCEYYSTRSGNYRYIDWYLPSICEMGYDISSYGTNCGSPTAPAQQNIQSNLVAFNNINLLAGYFWSSTESNYILGNPKDDAWTQFFNPTPNQLSTPKSFSTLAGIRCVRAF